MCFSIVVDWSCLVPVRVSEDAYCASCQLDPELGRALVVSHTKQYLSTISLYSDESSCGFSDTREDGLLFSKQASCRESSVADVAALMNSPDSSLPTPCFWLSNCASDFALAVNVVRSCVDLDRMAAESDAPKS